MLVVEDLHVSFGGVTALAGVSFVVRPGTITSLIGPNGAGKTTAFNAITGYLRAPRGRVTWDSQALSGRPCDIARRGVVRTFQKTSVFPALSVMDNVFTGLHLRGHAGVWSVLLGAPHVRAEERRLALGDRAVLVGGAEQIEFAGAGADQPGPAAAEALDAPVVHGLLQVVGAPPQIAVTAAPAARN